MYKLLLLALVPSVLARINIQITAGDKKGDARIVADGEDVDIISDKEKKSFKLSDEKMKTALNKKYGGNVAGVYLHGPTPWGDVWDKYGWSPVHRVLEPTKTRVLEISSEPSIFATRTFHNKSSHKAKYNAGIQEQVQTTTSNSWSSSHQITVGQEIEYSVDLVAAKVGGKTSFSYAGTWGKDETKSESVTLGTSSGIEVELGPGQTVVSELSAKRGTMKCEVDFAARLNGSLFRHYEKEFEGHYFWQTYIVELIKEMNTPAIVESTLKVSLAFFSDATIIVKDANSTYDKPIAIAKVPILLTSTPESRLRPTFIRV